MKDVFFLNERGWGGCLRVLKTLIFVLSNFSLHTGRLETFFPLPFCYGEAGIVIKPDLKARREAPGIARLLISPRVPGTRREILPGCGEGRLRGRTGR